MRRPLGRLNPRKGCKKSVNGRRQPRRTGGTLVAAAGEQALKAVDIFGKLTFEVRLYAAWEAAVLPLNYARKIIYLA
jgi:hypothetical protein